MPRVQGEDEEITETQTDASSGSRGAAAAAEIELAPLPEGPADYDGSTAVFSHAPARELQAAKSQTSAPAGSTMSHLAGAGPAHAVAAQTPATLRSGIAYPAGSVSGTAPRQAAPAVATAPSDVQIERPSIWKSFAWLMIFVACVLVFLVLRLLHSTHA
jgi:hypothetical protein